MGNPILKLKAFSSPFGAGLLSGALSGGVALYICSIYAFDMWAFSTFWPAAVRVFLLLLGPSICMRKWTFGPITYYQLFICYMCVHFASSMGMMFSHWWGASSVGFMGHAPHGVALIPCALFGAAIGYFNVRAYNGSSRAAGRAAILGAVAATTFIAGEFLVARFHRGQEDFMAFAVMAVIGSDMLLAALPTLALMSGSHAPLGWGVQQRLTRALQEQKIADTLDRRYQVAELYFESGDTKNAELNFTRVLDADPGSIDAKYYLGLCRLQQTDYTGALEYLTPVIDKNRNYKYGSAWLRYTECLVALGKQEQALEERRKLSRAFPRPLTEFAYAQLLHDSGNHDESRRVLEYMLETAQSAPAEDYTWVKSGRSLLKKLPD